MADQRDGAAGGDVEVEPVEHRPARHVLEGHVLEADLAVAGRQLDAPGSWLATSSGSSSTWKIRSPAAVARCAWPIHMPSERSGMTSIAR